jgi:hypothetical protein
MFWLQYKEAGTFQWREFGQSFYMVQECDLRAVKRRFVNYKFRLQFRPITKG